MDEHHCAQSCKICFIMFWHSHVSDHLWDSVFLVPTSCGMREIIPCSHKLWNKPSHVAMETLWMDPEGSFWTTFWSIAWNYRCRSLPVKKVWHHPRPCAIFQFCLGVTTHSFLNLMECECAAPWIQKRLDLILTWGNRLEPFKIYKSSMHVEPLTG